MKIRKTRARILAFLSGFIISGVVQAAEGGPVPAERPPATDVYHQVTVTDPYRWLENGADPKVHEWSAAQDQRARKYLDSLPLHAPIFKQLFSQLSATSSSYAFLFEQLGMQLPQNAGAAKVSTAR
jgi:protease II